MGGAAFAPLTAGIARRALIASSWGLFPLFRRERSTSPEYSSKETQISAVRIPMYSSSNKYGL